MTWWLSDDGTDDRNRLLRAGIMTTIPQRQRYRKPNEQFTQLRQLLDRKEITTFDFCGKCAAITISQKR